MIGKKYTKLRLLQLTKVENEAENASQKLLTDGGRSNQKLLAERSEVPSETRFTGDKNGGLSDSGRGNPNTVEPPHY